MIAFPYLDHRGMSIELVLANSPQQLYGGLLSLPSVRSLAEENTATALLEFARKTGSDETHNVESLALAYGAVVAATLRPYDEVRAAIDDQDVSGLEWAPAILEF